MRIIKLSKKDKDFATLDDMKAYFTEKLHARNGRFLVPPNLLAEDGLHLDEPLLFSYCGHVYYRANATSGRRVNEDDQTDNYPYYFLIDTASLQPMDISFSALRKLLPEEKLGRQGWTKIKNEEQALRMISTAQWIKS